MKQLIDKIKQEAVIKEESIIKVDHFLNHQIDVSLMSDIANVFYMYFQNTSITKIVTIESSGIAPAAFSALRFHVPCIFLKKEKPSTMEHPLSVEVFSYTKNKPYHLYVDAALFSQNDKVLFIDDFLANGEAFLGFEKLMKQMYVEIKGVGIVIEKSFQLGRNIITNKAYPLCSLARIASLKDNIITFTKEH
ncbi:MAG: xanthine phosphoribosyltransferase [Breznakia sp.]